MQDVPCGNINHKEQVSAGFWFKNDAVRKVFAVRFQGNGIFHGLYWLHRLHVALYWIVKREGACADAVKKGGGMNPLRDAMDCGTFTRSMGDIGHWASRGYLIYCPFNEAQ